MSSPHIVSVTSARVGDDPAITALVLDTRAQADAFIFLSGGASQMSTGDEHALVRLFESLAILAGDGVRFGVADGGTEAGIMQAAGRARAHSAHAFPLIGVSPMREIPPHGATPVDPNHTVIVAVDNPDWDAANGYFGSETAAMYQLFARLAEGRPSVAIVANGGEITLTEVDHNIRAGRHMILVGGSGRAADALASMLNPGRPGDDGTEKLRAQADALNLLRQPHLFHVFDMARGPGEFADALRPFLSR